MNLAAATNESLAQMSNTLIYSSMAVYTLAFLAHIAEWVLGSRSKVGRTAAALTQRAGAAPAVTVQVRGGGTAVLDKPKVVTRSAAGARDVPDGPGAAGGTVKGDLYGRIAVSLTTLAFLVEAGGVLTRALSVQRAPWGNMYEFSITFSTVAVGAYLGFLLARKNVRWMGLLLVTTVLLDLGIATTWLYTDSDQLVPALHSYWLWIHVSTAIFCGAVFYLGAVGTLLYLFRDSYENKLANGGNPSSFARSVLERLPAAASLDKFSYHINAAVFPLWTFTIIAGAIWAGDAWGRYWGWDPKEVWSFITW
ncbi:cytochrome c biogenesis protein CcsA, partial [Streptomyces sp.]|uniref:cytochrome c biogenesis protein CcsA n=1 Tax=Streptomyces sp. TaxID=1931 RepID=UPI002F950415